MTTFKVTLKPINRVVEVDSETNLLEALRANDVYIKSSCGGVASCSDCICKIVSGEDNLESPPFAELKLLGNVFHITRERLLCQTKIIGDVTIDISNHDKEADEGRLKNKTSKFQPKKPATKVRSQEDFNKIKEERYQERLKKQEGDQKWERFWEKNPDGHVKKGLGGGKRPKFFDTDKAIEATKQELLERDQKKERFKNYDEKNKERANEDRKNEESSESKSSNDFKKFRRD
jgi:ferredoxin